MKVLAMSVATAIALAAAGTVCAQEDLAKSSGCLNCHAVDTKKVGPAFKDVAAKYKDDASAAGRLADKVRRGGSGNWGSLPMPPNADLSQADLASLIHWVLGL